MMNAFLKKEEHEVNHTLLHDDLYMVNRALYDHCMLMELTVQKKIVDINDKYLDRFRYRKVDLLHHDIRVLNSGYHTDYYYDEAWSKIEAGQTWSGELCMKANNDEIVWLFALFIPLCKGSQEVQSVLAIFNEITKQKQVDKWKYIAMHNELTNLPNRRKFEATLTTKIKGSLSGNSKFALVFIDIDSFKNINDSFGHATGDQVLQEFANRLRTPIFGNCKVFHQSGDEFVLIVDYSERLNGQLTYMLKRLNEPIKIKEKTMQVTASVGVSIFPDDSHSIEEILDKADQAMYASKRNGGNRYQLFERLGQSK